VHGRTHEIVEHLVVDSAFGDPEHRGRECEAGIAGVLLATPDRQPSSHVAKHAQRAAVIERAARLGNESRIGRIEDVLVEGPSKRDPAVLTGRTRQNRLVHFSASEPLRTGTYARVRVQEAATFHLNGELVEVTAPARHRTRIPVAAR